MAFVNAEISFKIFDSYSLKDKRRTVKSLINRMHNRYNISLAEVGEHDMLNVGKVGIAVASESPIVAKKILEQVITEIEDHYEIEIFETVFL